MVLALDARLAGVVRAAREPMLAQLRLAWWRDRLSEDPTVWPRGEPVLAALANWGKQAAGLVALVDGWEALLDEPPLTDAAIEGFVCGRSAAIGALAARVGVGPDEVVAAARDWALADLALHLGDPAERACASALIGSSKVTRLPRAMRPLAVMAGLNLRALRRGARDPLDGPVALLAAIRLGFVSR
ncbi:hypothetical protein H7F53_10115 [Novosphingobium piscinae]|uniref:Phytoene synthase n=1 Tax=Novosphingobium piscinae TaxID=1507448 RepID=A0A7X1FYV4_9SPHN|nr:hypothetical protein [Novosphingobium piscinae]MBC2669498.1 hypothetical protein [Novosphingobium piscinae]